MKQLKFSKQSQIKHQAFEDQGQFVRVYKARKKRDRKWNEYQAMLNLHKKKRVKSSKSKLKAKAWSEFSKYIRNKYAVDGVVTCYTCGKQGTVKTMQAGHGIGGRANSILFEERVVRPQCVGCNVFGRGQYRVFTRKLIAELGLDVYDALVKQADENNKLTEKDLQAIYEKYRALNNEI